MNNNDLKDRLEELRDTIRKENIFAGGGMPTVCTDTAIDDMVRIKPTTVPEICSIEGTSSKFRNDYADRFLAEIAKATETPSDNISNEADEAKTANTKRILTDLAKKLTDMSKTNSMLMQLKAGRRMDMSYTGISIAELIGDDSIVLCDRMKGKDDIDRHEKITEIIRAVKHSQRDRGQNELYVAYPFVEGKVGDADPVVVRAPLALFPVAIKKQSSKMVMKADFSRDVIVNSNLILAVMNRGGNIGSIASTIIENVSTENFRNSVIELYEKYNISISGDIGPVEPFVEYSSTDFDPAQGLTITNNMILGRYTNDSNAIQRDMGILAEKCDVSEVVTDLISNTDMENFYFELDTSETVRRRSVPEEKLNYINSLNGAQEQIIDAVYDKEAIAIQGPPGTGKSQVITGLVVSAIANGQKVLVVSEKKTALDVIRSRLGDIGDMMMEIDDSSDKGAFYNQIERFMDSKLSATPVDLSSLNAEINERVAKLEAIGDSIYTKMKYGVTPSYLYSLGTLFDLSDSGVRAEYTRIQKSVPKELLSVDYDTVRAIHDDLNDSKNVKNSFEFIKMSPADNWVGKMKKGLTDNQLIDIMGEIGDLKKAKEAADSAGVIKKLVAKKEYDKRLSSFAGKYFDDVSAVNKLLNCDPDTFFGMYRDFNVKKATFSEFEKERELYINTLYKLCNGNCNDSVTANRELFDYINDYHLREFDAAIPQIHGYMRDYGGILNEIDLRMNRKKDLERDVIKNNISSSLALLNRGGAKGDILRVLESKNRWSINKFMSRFEKILFDSVKVWLMTPEAVSDIMPLRKDVFDILIFDEASQIYVERAIPAIYRSKKVVIAGDHKQLRPSAVGQSRITFEEDAYDIEDEIDMALEQESLLDLARLRYDSYILNYHYRSKYQELIEYSNSAFYGGKLLVSPSAKPSPTPPIEYHRIEGLWNEQRNKVEATKVVEFIKTTLKERKEQESIGVITFNLKQADMIESLLEKEAGKDAEFARIYEEECARKTPNGEDVGLFVKNIENVQGDERDIIIFSIGYDKTVTRFGSLSQKGGENRLNVAISRAKSKIHIFASMDPAEMDIGNAQNEGAGLLKGYLRYSKAVSDGDVETVNSILGTKHNVTGNVSEIKDEICEYLKKQGFDAVKDVGVGGYCIDVGIRGKDNNFAIGIELDTSIYGDLSSAREHDVHRTNYLASRGWKICRCWTPEFWMDKQKELVRIGEEIAEQI